jgi:hypothetical protein
MDIDQHPEHASTKQEWSITEKLNNIIILMETFSVITILVNVNRIKKEVMIR